MSEERRSTLNAILATVLVVSALAGVASPAGAEPAAGAAPELGIDPDDVLMRVDVAPDGSAAWTIEYRVRLDDDNATRAFESIRSDVEENETRFASSFGDRMRAAADRAENATGREMEIRNVSVSATRQQLPREYGVVTYRFEWDGFAARTGDELRIGDALSGLFLDRETTLLIGWPADHRATSVAPTPDDRRESAVVWIGPTDFGPGEPAVTVAPDPATPEPTAATAPPADTESETPADGGDGASWPLALVGLLAVGGAGAIGVAALRRRESEPAEPISDAAPSGDGETGVEPEAEGDAETDAETEPEPPADPEPPEELLSNEERVLRLVRERGGRLKQQEVAEALDWTDAKTSQVVRSMREEGQLDAFRLGRENVLTLPDEDSP